LILQRGEETAHECIEERVKPRFVIGGSLLLTTLWVVAALCSSHPLDDSLLLVVLQALLALLALWLLTRRGARPSSPGGPTMMRALGLHALLYYGIANVVPALLLQWRAGRPSSLEWMPASPIVAYSLASLAALLFLAGAWLGDTLADGILPMRAPRSNAWDGQPEYPWLPGYRLAIAACVSLLLVVGVGTAIYGLQWGTVLTEEAIAGLTLAEQLLFHGVFVFLPVPPLLAAIAYVRAETRRRRQIARWLLILAALVTLAGLAAWRMRSIAMIAITLPVVLLVHAGRLSARRVVLPSAILAALVYSVVTVVRLSDLPALIETEGVSRLRAFNVISAFAGRSQDETVLGRALFDLSYRTAGLEAVAPILQAQTAGWLEPRWGEVMWADFLQALPAAFRPEFQLVQRTKTAPGYYGVFREGDWVTTPLAELALDFGPFLLFFPAIMVGLGLSLIDRGLLRLGMRPRLQGLLVLRFAWLLGLVLFEVDIFSRTLNFFKATAAYTVLLLLLGYFMRDRGVTATVRQPVSAEATGLGGRSQER